ncbi:hypothetical protein WJX82_005045 [Trebouxia sp. C0006]
MTRTSCGLQQRMLSSTCTQQKRITDRLGILCFEHHNGTWDWRVWPKRLRKGSIPPVQVTVVSSAHPPSLACPVAMLYWERKARMSGTREDAHGSDKKQNLHQGTRSSHSRLGWRQPDQRLGSSLHQAACGESSHT